MTDKKKLRFSVKDDITLLKETVARNPFDDTTKWKIITSNVVQASGKNFSLRAVREHVDYLISLWTKHDFGNLRKSGTAEQYHEKEQLLQEAKSLKEEFQKKRCKKNVAKDGIQTSNVATSVIEVAEFYEQAEPEYLNLKIETSMEESSSIHSVIKSDEQIFQQDPLSEGSGQEEATSAPASATPPARRSYPATPVLGPTNFRRKRKSSTLIEYLKEKLMYDSQIRDRELMMEAKKIEIEERKIALEEEKAKMNYKQMEARLEMDRKEQEHRIRMTEQQQNIINLVFDSFYNLKRQNLV